MAILNELRVVSTVHSPIFLIDDLGMLYVLIDIA